MKRIKAKRLAAFMLALLMLVALLPVIASPANAAETGTATFSVNGTVYGNLGDAIAAAGSNGTIVLATSGTITGNYTIPSGVKLLIPVDDANTLYTNAPEAVGGGAPTGLKAYRTLTMVNGSSITVNGVLSLSAKVAGGPGGGTNSGGTTGAYGHIAMEPGSTITVNNGGVLYAWGYISGSGNVIANSGAKIYEPFQIGDFRGGSALLKWYGGLRAALFQNPKKEYKMFPVSQYYIQNIEVPLTLRYGSSEYGYATLYADGDCISQEILIIGKSGALFNMTASDSVIVKSYDGSRDRQVYDIYGNASVEGITIAIKASIVNINFSSTGYILPITNNMTMNVHSGTTILGQDMALLPGVEASIDLGATLNIKSGFSLVVYDGDEWGNYAGSRKLSPVPYGVSKTYTRTAADLKDVVVDVNGTIKCDGYLYTTTGGADIKSSQKTGKVVFAKGAGTATTTEQLSTTDSISKVTINITSAKLHNGDGSYTATAGAAANTTYSYCSKHDMWEKADLKKVIFNANADDVEGTMGAQSICTTGDNLTANAFTREGYTFDGWNTKADGTGTSYSDAQSVTLTADLTLYAQWKEVPLAYTVTWKNADGTVLKTDADVEAGTMPKYTGATPTKADDTAAKVRYVFAGWDKTLAPVTGDVTYTATFTEAPLYYAVELYYDDAADPVYTKPETLYKNSLKLTAENPRNDGKQFSHWSIQYFDAQGNSLGDAVEYPATQITVHPGVGGITVRARAIYGDETFEAKPFVKIIGAEFNPLTNKWSFTLTQSVPGANAEEVGFVLSTTNRMPELGGEGVIRTTSTKQLPTSTFTANVSMDGWEGQTLYVRAYLTSGGKTIYSAEAVEYPYPGA